MADILVIGPGRLGMIVARGWKAKYAGSRIFLKFHSDNEERTMKMREEGFSVFSDVNDNPVRK